MTYPTHKQYSIGFAYIAVMLLYKYNITSINYYLTIPIILMASKYGGLFPDIDHNWQSVKDKTVINWIINKFIHLTGGKHRSWQTHSIDILAILIGLTYGVNQFILTDDTFGLGISSMIKPIDREIMLIILYGFYAGWISHLVADMMTSAGIRLFCWNKKLKIKLVPKNIGKLKFNTGHEWEEFVYGKVKFLNIILGILCIIWPAIV